MTFITAAASSGVQVDEISFFVIVVAAALAALAVAFFGSRVAIPVVVIELLLGIVIGPQILDFAQPDNFVGFFASLGLGMLFFFAGYEIDFQRIRGKALNLAIAGWISNPNRGHQPLASLELFFCDCGTQAANTPIFQQIHEFKPYDEPPCPAEWCTTHYCHNVWPLCLGVL